MIGRLVAADREEDRPRLSRASVTAVDCLVASVSSVGRRIEVQRRDCARCRRGRDRMSTTRSSSGTCAVGAPRRVLAAARGPRTGRRSRCRMQRWERDADGTVADIAQRQPLIRRSRHRKMVRAICSRSFCRTIVLVGVDVGIGEIDGEQRVVVAQVRARAAAAAAVHQQLELRKVAGVVVEQTLGPPADRANVAMAVEHPERVAVLQNPAGPDRGPMAGLLNGVSATPSDFSLAGKTRSVDDIAPLDRSASEVHGLSGR